MSSLGIRWVLWLACSTTSMLAACGGADKGVENGVRESLSVVSAAQAQTPGQWQEQVLVSNAQLVTTSAATAVTAVTNAGANSTGSVSLPVVQTPTQSPTPTPTPKPTYGSTAASGPVASLVASRLSGTAPLCVHFDATGSTDADTTNPFRDLLYRWNFGDPGSGTWARGANTTLSKNQARGAVAGHCYETAGSYTAKLQVCDATSCASATQAITVTAADATYAGAATTCFYNSAVGSGCPAGATQTASSDFDAAIAACLASGKRCLFKRGDTFPASATTVLSGTISGAHIGAYGTGSRPLITISGIDFFRLTGTLSEITFSDLEVVGAGLASKSGTFINFAASTTNMTFLRVTCRDHGACYSVTGTGDTNIATGLFIVDGSMYAYTGGNGSYIGIRQSALMGNFVDDARGPGYPGCPTCKAEHGLRIQYGQKSAISNNYFGKASPNKHQLTIRAAPRGATGAVSNLDLDTNRIIISDNYFDSTALGVWKTSIGPSSDYQCHWIQDVLVERNFFASSLSGTAAVRINAVRVTVRNNIQIMTGTGDSFVAVGNSNNGTCSEDPVVNSANAIPVPDDNWIGNNTIYRTGAAINFTPIRIFGNGASAVTNTAVYNNLTYSPNVTNTTTVYTTGSTAGTFAATNSTSTQAMTVNPFLTTPSTAISFRIDPASYAASGGTLLFPASVEDFRLCKDRNGSARIGALVPDVLAQCPGSAM